MKPSHFNDFNNSQVAKLPNHLKKFIVEQHYEHYTPLDHAVWRYIMRQNYSYLKDIAYYPYIPGLQAAGLSIEKIPCLQEMNDALGKIGWGAVTVDGFIPPATFMEYQAYRVLVIAADIRQLEHIEYTPAPDIIHESAGHAPIIADSDYHAYLSYFGSIGAKAIFSAKDFELYEAIRELSILKEMPQTSILELQNAEKKVALCQNNLGEPSEMALLSRLHWWTVEYGLIGSLDNPKIYGAGLLSSIGESANCMNSDVKKLRYTLNAVHYPFDITKPQPHLFVTPTFQNLIDVLEQFADTMAFRRGGHEGLLKAIACNNICTAVYSSGIQVSGVFTRIELDSENKVSFIKTHGPSALSFDYKQLTKHDKYYHKDGFSSPVGLLKGYGKALEDLSLTELKDIGVEAGKASTIHFESGIIVSGIVKQIEHQKNKIILISFSDCTVKDDKGHVFFEPSWGIYDMAVGKEICSVFCGAADKDAFEEKSFISKTTTHHPVYDDETKQYHQLFQTVRDCREQHTHYEQLPLVWEQLKNHFGNDWLCAIEILELLNQEHIMPLLSEEIQTYLTLKADKNPEKAKLIQDGFYLIKNPVNQLTTN